MIATKNTILKHITKDRQRLVQLQNRHVHAAQSVLHLRHLNLLLLAQISSLLDLIEALFLTDSHYSHRMLHHHHLLPRSQIENDDVNEVDNVLHSVLQVHREQVNSGLRAVVGLSGHLLRADEAIVQQRQHRLRFNSPLRSDRSADLLGQHADVRDLLLVQLLVLDQRANNARAHALLPRLSLTRPA